MERTTVKVGLACGLGALVGTLVALALGAHWWLGLFAGGIVGYLAFDLRAVLLAIPAAWRATAAIFPSINDLKLRMLIGFWLVCFVTYFALWIGMVVLPILRLFTSSWGSGLVGYGIVVGLFSVYFGLSAMISPQSGEEMRWRGKKSLEELESSFRDEVKTMIFEEFTPVVIGRGVLFCIVRIPRAGLSVVRGICLFLWNLYLSIHSNLRVLCLVDSAIGTFLGYLLGSALAGGLIACVWGILNYEILAKRVLRTVPVRV